MKRFVSLVVCAVFLSTCTVPAVVLPTVIPSGTSTRVVTPSITETTTPVPVTPTMPAKQGPLVVRIIQSDANSVQPLVDVITQTAALYQLPVQVDVRSPDGTYALAATTAIADDVDVWIGSEYDVQQLARLQVVAATAPGITVPHFAYIDDAIKRNLALAVMPIALRNYLVSMGNATYLDTLPDTTADLMGISGFIRGRVRYKMAFSWAEGRWFDMLINQLRPNAVLTSSDEALPDDVLLTALTSLYELRTLGPRDATTYVDATSDFINWYVPYTIDGDAAIRRYEKYRDNLELRFAAPPVYAATGERLMPAVDTVYAIISTASDTSRRQKVESFVQALQQTPVQQTIFRSMRWIPINRAVYDAGDLDDDPLYVVLQPFIPVLTTQRYTDAIICRWDAYEKVLPLVLLDTIRLQAGVDAMNNALHECITKP